MRRASAALLAGVLVAAALLVVTGPVAGAGPVGGPPAPRVHLRYQDPWVGPESTLRMDLTVDDAPEGAQLSFQLYGDTAVAGRNRYLQTMRGEQLGATIRSPLVVPVTNLVDNGDGTLGARFEVSEARQPFVGFRLPGTGVYPLGVVLQSAEGRQLDAFMTSIVRLPEAVDDDNPALAFAVVAPLSAPPALGTDGRRSMGAAGPALDATLDVVTDSAGVPLTLDATPETLQGLADRDRQAGTNDVASLATAMAGRQILGGPYVELDLGGWAQPALRPQLPGQLAAGGATLASTVGVDPGIGTYVLDATATPEAVNALREQGVQRVVVAEERLTDLDPRAFGVTLTRSFALDTGGPTTLPALQADLSLRFHAVATDSPALNAQHLLADLAVLYLDRPGWRRGAVLLLPEDGSRAPFLGALLTALAAGQAIPDGTKPVVEPTTLDGIFSFTEAAGAGGGRAGRGTGPGEPTLVRSLEPRDPPAPNPAVYARALGNAQHTLDGFRSMVGPTSPRVAPLDELVRTSGARQLDPAGAQAYLDAAVGTAQEAATQVTLPEQQQVTLTSREGTIPLDIENRQGEPVEARVTVTSDKLEFPNGATFTTRLAPGPNRIDVAVHARGSGAFPVDVDLASPDGVLQMSSGRFTVRSTAVSGIGLVLSIGAGLFLAVWWLRHFRKVRRSRRLVASAHPSRRPDATPA